MNHPNAHGGIQIDCEIQLRGDFAHRLCAAAERLGREPIVLLADLIDRVLLDDLVDAVLDEGAE